MTYTAFLTVVVLGIVATGLTASAAPHRVGEVWVQPDAGRLELFDDKDFKGKSSALTRPSPELGSMSGHADSLRLSGTWQICDQENFRGHCRIVSQNIADLNRIGWKNRIRSARPR